MLTVTLFTFDPDGGLVEEEPETVDYVSLYNGGTHGPPALVAPGRERGENVQPTARPGDDVLYINTALIPAYKVHREDD
jgi:hypothetical protein